jgi:transposase
MENELKINAKKVSIETQYEIRKTIVRMLKNGVKGSEIAKQLGVSEGHVSNVKKAYKQNGIEGIKPKKEGRKVGEKRILTPEQENEIMSIIVEKDPTQLKFKECMWTRKNIRQLIKEKYGIDIKLSTLGYYLARWGFSVQRPVKRAYKQDPKKIDKWLNDEFPGITERANAENAEIFFGDETNIQNTCNYMRGYAPKGKTPVVMTESQKFKINMLSAVSKRGKLKFMLYKDNMNSDKMIDFIRRLVKDSNKKVFLILDNLRVHHSKKVTAWLEGHKEKIEVFFLPPYAPEYNPDELVNSDLKRAVGQMASPSSETELENNVRSHLKKLQHCSEKITAFFNAPFTSYAAA